MTTTDRRTLLKMASQGTLASTLLALHPQLLAQNQGESPLISLDPSVLKFWTSEVRIPYQLYLEGIEHKGNANPGPADSTFVFPSARGLVPATTLKPTDVENFPETGDIDVTVHVERFRPSTSDMATFANLQTGTLRMDVKQVSPMPGLTEALAWTAMATLASRRNGQTVPNLDSVKFDPGTVWDQFQSIPLNGGIGFWSWNFFMKKREGFWGQLLDVFFKTLDNGKPFLDLLGLPGIAVSGLKYIDQILGTVQAQGESQWMFKGLDIPVCATKAAFTKAGGSRKLLLTNGSYIIIPEVSVSKLDKDLVVQDGLLVPPDTSPLQIYAASKTILPEVSYMTVTVTTSSKTQPSTN